MRMLGQLGSVQHRGWPAAWPSSVGMSNQGTTGLKCIAAGYRRAWPALSPPHIRIVLLGRCQGKLEIVGLAAEF